MGYAGRLVLLFDHMHMGSNFSPSYVFLFSFAICCLLRCQLFSSPEFTPYIMHMAKFASAYNSDKLSFWKK